jgi:uncharacterized phosphatase
MTNTYLGLLRHGQTDWNIDMRLQGTADIPMNEIGIEQIRRAADALVEHNFDVLISSPLGRARHSAELVAMRLGIADVIESELLLERSFGVGEGLSYSEWQEKYAGLDDIPGAESSKSVARRSQILLDHIKDQFAGARVLAVSHGALIRFVLAEVSEGKIPPPGERLQNASLHTLRHGAKWELDGWAPHPLGEVSNQS